MEVEIAPVFDFQHIGGSNNDEGKDIAVTLIIYNRCTTEFGSTDAFVAKYDGSTGNQIYFTYISGMVTMAMGVTVDASGNVYVV